MLQNLQSDPACGSNKETTAPHRSFVLSVKEGPNLSSSARLSCFSVCRLPRKTQWWVGRREKVDVIFLPVGLDNLAVDKLCGFAQTGEQKISPLWVSI